MVDGFLHELTDAVGTLGAQVAEALGIVLADTISPAWVVAGACVGISLLAFHAVAGSPHGRWAFELPFAITAFAGGNALAYFADWPTPVLGDVHPVEGAIGTWLVLGAFALVRALAPTQPSVPVRRGRFR